MVSPGTNHRRSTAPPQYYNLMIILSSVIGECQVTGHNLHGALYNVLWVQSSCAVDPARWVIKNCVLVHVGML